MYRDAIDPILAVLAIYVGLPTVLLDVGTLLLVISQADKEAPADTLDALVWTIFTLNMLTGSLCLAVGWRLSMSWYFVIAACAYWAIDEFSNEEGTFQ